ncbi:hypothetical protein [Endothiovibrio diazotrophicus]
MKSLTQLLLLLSALATPPALAVPDLLDYQGRLPGVAAGTTRADLTFTLYDRASGGTALWSETLPGVPLTDGLFSVQLGLTAPGISLQFDGADRWLEIQVDGGPPVAPRSRIGSVPHAILSGIAERADRAAEADHALTADYADTAGTALNVDGADISPTSVAIAGYGPVISADGQWLGEPTGLEGPEGPRGETGPAGPQGETGPRGPVGGGFGAIYTKMCFNRNSSVRSYYDCACNAGDTILSGGAYTDSGGVIRESRPINTTTWRVACSNFYGNNQACHGFVITCSQ